MKVRFIRPGDLIHLEENTKVFWTGFLLVPVGRVSRLIRVNRGETRP